MNDGRKKKPQKHQNRTAFKITFDTQALQKQKKVSLTDLCVRCTQQLEWKLQYNKYKKMTEPARCNICLQKTVYRTYMTACQPCVEQKKICAKCLAPDYEAPEEVKVSEKDKKQQERVEYANQIEFMKTLQERSRRTVRRNLEKGKITWSQEEQYFLDENGNKMIGLHFRKGFTIDEDGNEHDQDGDIMDEMDDDDDMFGDEDDMDEDEQAKEKQPKKDKKQQPSQENSKSKKSDANKQDQQKEQEDQEQNSDVEGDQVDCENDIDFGDQENDDQDIGIDDDLDGQQDQEEQQPKGKNDKQKK